MQSALERRYRRLLRAFPRGYREHRGEEMLATLLESAHPDQQRPSTRDTVELLQGALRERLGMHGAAGLPAGLRIAAPVCLAVATADAIHIWTVNPTSVVLGVVAAGWLAAALALALLPRLMPALIAAAWLTTLVASVLAGPASDMVATGKDGGLSFPGVHPYSYAVEVVCGLIAVTALLTVAWRPSPVERVGVAGAVAGATAFTVVAHGLGGAVLPEIVLIDPSWMVAVRLLPAALLVAGLITVVRRRSTALLWAALLLLVPVPVMGPWLGAIINPPDWQWQTGSLESLLKRGPLALVPGEAGFFGILPWGAIGSTLVGAITIAAVFLADANRRGDRPRDGRSVLSALSALALGSAAGLCAFVLADTGYHGDLVSGDIVAAGPTVVAALLVPWLPPRWRRPLILAALAAVIVVATVHGWTTGLQPEFLIMLGFLLPVAFGDVRGSGRLVGGGAAAGVALGVWLQWLSANEFWPNQSLFWQANLSFVGGVILLFTLGWAAVVVIRADRGWFGAAVAFVTSLLWLGFQVHLATALGPLIAALASVAILVFAARVVVRRGGRPVSDTT